MALLAWFAFVALVALEAAEPAAKSPPSVDEIVSTLEHAQSLIHNVDMSTIKTSYHRTTPLEPPKDRDFRPRNVTRFVYDNKRNIRIEDEELLLDSNGNYIHDWYSLMTWDNQKQMMLDETPEHRTVIISAEDNVNIIWNPTERISIQGKPVAKVMKELKENSGQIRIEVLDSGLVLASLSGFPKDALKSVRLELDPDRMFYPRRLEIYKGDRLTRTFVSEPQDAGGGIWVPKTVLTKAFIYDGDTQTLDYEEELVVEKARVNVPNLDPKIFEIELTPETLVRDLRAPIVVEKYHGTDKMSKIEEKQFTKNLLKDISVPEPSAKQAAQTTTPAAPKTGAVEAKPDNMPPALWLALAIAVGCVALLGVRLLSKRAKP